MRTRNAPGPFLAFAPALEIAFFSVVAIHLLHYWQPLGILHLFEGDYLASFFLIVGVGLLLLHPRIVAAQLSAPSAQHLLVAAFSAMSASLPRHWLVRTYRLGCLAHLPALGAFPCFLVAAFVFLIRSRTPRWPR